MKKTVKTYLIFLLAVSISGSLLSSCGSKNEFSTQSLKAKQDTLARSFAFDSQNQSDHVTYDESELAGYIGYVKSLPVDYGYPELFNYEKAMEGISANHTVAQHQYSALDEHGELTKEHLLEIVNKNTAEYLEGESTKLIKPVDNPDFLIRICEIIVDVTNDMLNQYPEIDKARVYCNLGYLKIIEKTSALDFAAVEPGMVLHINRNTTQIVDIMPDASMYSVLVHETMHILQYGCPCETNEGCVRRCGLAHSYNWEQDYADWTWLAEGSAERMANIHSNVAPMTYTNMVNYIVSIDLSTMLQNDVPANYLETLSFYGEPEKLFDLFGCENDQEREEVYHLMYALEIMQMRPDDLVRAYERIYGVEWNEELENDLFNKIKRPIVMTLTKNFYRNLAETVSTSSMTQNDLLFLINLYENTINCHIRFDNSEYDAYNAEFFNWYADIRNRFFLCFDNIDLNNYKQYVAVFDEKTINASLHWLDSEKKNFLIDKYEAASCEYKLQL